MTGDSQQQQQQTTTTTAERPLWSPLFFFAWIVIAGVIAKLALAFSLLYDDDSLTGLFWAPLGILGEVLLGLVPVVLYAVLGLRGPRAIIAGLLSLVVVVVDVGWQSVSLVSWLVSRTGIRWERMRGDEGVTFADAHLVANIDRIPGYVYGGIAFVVGAVLAHVLSSRRSVSARRFVVVGVVALTATLLDAVVLRSVNLGVGAQPLLYLGETWVRSLIPPTPLVLKTKIPEPTTPAELAALLAGEQPQPPVPARPAAKAKNVIVFFGEGIAREHTALGGNPAATPNLARRAANGGLELTHHYSPYHKSIAAIFSFACADWPPPSSKSITEVRPRIDCGEFSEVMAQNEVHTGLFHGGDFGFYDKLALLGMRGYEIQRDRQALQKKGDWQNTWGLDDRIVVDATLSWIDSIPKKDGAPERFAAWLIPITAHYPHGYPPDHDTAFPGFAGRSRYLSAVHFVDDVFERLMKGLEQRGLADDTIVIFTGDHGETIGEHPRKSAGRRLMYEPSVRVPLLVFAPRLFPTPQRSDRNSAHVDLLPTILDLMGLPKDERHVGRSIYDELPPRRVLLGANNGPRYIGFVDGDLKLILNQTAGEAELYDLKNDPEELHDLHDEIDPAELDRLLAELTAIAAGQNAHLRNAKSLPNIDVENAVYEQGRVRLLRGDQVVPCERGDAGFTCGSDVVVVAPPMKRQAQKGRRCASFAPPAGATIEMSLDKAPVLPMLARVRVAALDDGRSEAITTVGVSVDGGAFVSRSLSGDKDKRISHKTPTSSWAVRVEGGPPLCVTFSDKGWRP
ncbi:MAG: sulfatase-like hydrolase/transferase [Deltaproteobacteria bacterium]|nr:sulfatase-like hydrolase/transferase [Deltaproteobacteria bacterium]